MFIPLQIIARVFASLLLAFGVGVPSIDTDADTASFDQVRVADEPTSPPVRTEAPAGEPVDTQAEPAKLVTDSGNLVLEPGVFQGSFELTNIGGQAADWTWLGDPRVTVEHTSGTLAPGASITVGFQIDASALQPGENLLPNCVDYNGGAIDIWITATKVSMPTIPAQLTS
jgi:hypothetical protein